MPILNEKQLGILSKEAAKQFLETNIPLDNVISKIAEDHSLSSEQIKRVVEGANNETYLAIKPTAKEGYPEFDTADYEKVANRLFGEFIPSVAEYEPVGDLRDYAAPYKEPSIKTGSGIASISQEMPKEGEVTEHQAYMIMSQYRDGLQDYDNIILEKKARFNKMSMDFYNQVQQEVLSKKASFGELKAALIGSQQSNFGIRAMSAVLDSFKDDLIKEGADRYPSLCDLSDLSLEKVAELEIINSDNTIVKAGLSLVKLAEDVSELIEKRAANAKKILMGSALLTAGAAIGKATNQVSKEELEAWKAIKDKNISGASLNNAGFRAAIKRY